MARSDQHLIFIVGTRAQLIKMAPVVLEAEKQSIPCTLLMTGQHKETMQDLLDEFGVISPQVKAVQESERATVSSLIAWLFVAYSGIGRKLTELVTQKPNSVVLVHGDTLSAALGAFLAKRRKIRVVHLESGLTSGKLFDPFPEEMCRRLVFRFADIAMCPTEEAEAHMRKYPGVKVVNTRGNTIEDAVVLTGALEVRSKARSGSYLLASLHRFQNLYNRKRLREIVTLLVELSNHYRIVFVLHPATRGRLRKTGLWAALANRTNIELKPRMGYREFLRIAAGSSCVLTDGGSNQEELAMLGVPTLIMRAHTERPDGLGANAVMESDVPGGVLSFLVNDRYQELARIPRAINERGPSYNTIQALSQD